MAEWNRRAVADDREDSCCRARAAGKICRDMVRSTSVRAGLAQRARSVLSVAEVSNTDIAEKAGTTRTTVIAWQARYTKVGIEELADHDRLGRSWRSR